MEPVNIGLLGMGTVGGGTVNVLTRNAEEISRRAGRGLQSPKNRRAPGETSRGRPSG